MLSDSNFASLPSISVAAHELKTPIALMRQLSLILQDESLTEGEKLKYQNQLITTADRALEMTTDLSQVANLQPSLFPIEPVNVLAVCQVLAEEMKPVARMYDREIAWPRAGRRQAALVVANRRLLGRIISNFVDNALKYTDKDQPISVTVQRKKDVIRLGVRDYGPRMTNREYAKLVDEMEQKKSVKTRPESSGLGVFIASQFATAMDGSVGLVRHRDGVTFYVELSLSRQTSWL